MKCSRKAEKEFVQHNVEQDSVQTTCLSEERLVLCLRFKLAVSSNEDPQRSLCFFTTFSLSHSLCVAPLLFLALAFPSDSFLHCFSSNPVLSLMVICVIKVGQIGNVSSMKKQQQTLHAYLCLLLSRFIVEMNKKNGAICKM